MIRRCLGLDLAIDPMLKAAEKAGLEYVKLIENGAGRLLRSPTLWEDAAKTLFTTNCTWALTQKMCNAACSGAFTDPAPSGKHPFPCPDRLCSYPENQLKAMLPVGYRAGYLKELGDRFSKDPDLRGLEVNGYDYDQADQIVRRSKGFADYACSQLLVFAGFYDEIPVDTTVVAYLKRNHPRVRKHKAFIDRRYRKWGPYKWWGYKFDTMLARQNWIGD
jgi:N-glycosylase/DNA lyase